MGKLSMTPAQVTRAVFIFALPVVAFGLGFWIGGW